MTKTLAQPVLQLHLLGPMTVSRNGVAVALPASRKVRALLAYLAMSSRELTREHLCEMLGDIADDPRAELRWCLSKARVVLDDGDRRRLCSHDDRICVDLSGCSVDALEVTRAIDAGLGMLDAASLKTLADRFAGDFLETMHLERSPHLNNWLAAQRRRFRACRIAILEHRVAIAAAQGEDAEGDAAMETWLQLAPFDVRAHERLLQAFGLRGQADEAERHLAAATGAFEAEGLDPRPLRAAWLAARPRVAGAAALPSPRASPMPARARAAGAAPGIGAPTLQAAATPSEAGIAANSAGSIEPTRRASVAVMPFVEWPPPTSARRGGLADALAHDIITRLAKLRSLFVIAQGTVFALDRRSIGAEAAGRTLNVDFVAGGSLRRHGRRVAINVELVETRTARVVWAEPFDCTLDDTFRVLDEIGNRIVARVAGEIEAVERNRAVLKAPSSLDAWEAHHRGLWHMYRFNRDDNDLARHFFELALRLDPTFSRAHAGLSFTHWQNAFQHWGNGSESAVEQAFAAAAQSLVADDRDPAAHWAMGRALWLGGRQEHSLVELEKAVELSPNFALGHYALAFVHSQSGDPRAAIASADQSRRLSPYDPLLFGILASRAMALVRLGLFDEAAEWSLKAAARPNAHAHIQAIAVHCLALAGRFEEARRFAASIHATLPQYRVGDFLSAFKFAPDAEALYRSAAARIGMA